MPMIKLIMIVLAMLASGSSKAATDTGKCAVIRGQLDGALYVIVKPTDWNGRLLLYQHGMGDSSLPLAAEINVGAEPYKSLLADGWMVAASSYRRSGFIVRDAIDDVRKLHQYIIATYGKPKRTLLMGASMGGAITIRLVEADPATFDGAIVLGTALQLHEKELADLTYDAKIPVIFMTNQSEVDQSAGYVKKTVTNGVPSALWIVERNGHINFNGGEYLAVVHALDRWVDGGKIEMERKFALVVEAPPSTARFADGGAYGTVREVSGGFGNLRVSFVEADFKRLGISLGAGFQLKSGEQIYSITYANTFTDVPSGKWVCFQDADGYHVIAICFGNAAKTAGIKPGDEIFIRKN